MIRSEAPLAILASLLVVETVVLAILLENQLSASDLLVKAVELEARMNRLINLDTVFFRLIYLQSKTGGLLPISIVISNSDYMQYRDRMHHNLTMNFEVLDYAPYITPDDEIIKELAVKMRNLFPDSLDYARAVLHVVHQIFYYSPPDRAWHMKYPVETLAEGSGLCAHLSVLAASLLRAEGFDVILTIYYNPDPRQAGHMNIGVNLPSPPFEGAYFIEHEGKRYYVAETTNYLFNEEGSFSWQESWKIGQMPPMLKDWKYRVIVPP